MPWRRVASMAVDTCGSCVVPVCAQCGQHTDECDCPMRGMGDVYDYRQNSDGSLWAREKVGTIAPNRLARQLRRLAGHIEHGKRGDLTRLVLVHPDMFSITGGVACYAMGPGFAGDKDAIKAALTLLQRGTRVLTQLLATIERDEADKDGDNRDGCD